MLTTLIDGTPVAGQHGATKRDDSGSLLHGSSSVTTSLRGRLRSLAPYFRTALITGEAGVGKRRVARELHRLSHPAGPFVSYRTGLPEPNSPAHPSDRRSERLWPELLQSAEGGTLVVEEVGDLSLSDQASLLQLLREPRWRNAGPSRAQVIGTSLHEPRLLVTTGRLRQDLHAMFSAVDLRLQPLRSRPEDVEELALEFLAEAAAEFRLGAMQLSAEAFAMLQGPPWPGNVAELRSVLRHALQTERGPVLTAASLDPAPRERSDVSPARSSLLLQEVIDAHVSKVLATCGGNKLKTAELLGVSRSTLYRMLEGSAPPMRGGRPA